MAGPPFQGLVVLLGDRIVGRDFGAPDGVVGTPFNGSVDLDFAPPESRQPLMRFSPTEGFIKPGDLLRHVSTNVLHTIVHVDVFALYRLAVATAAQRNQSKPAPVKKRKLRPKIHEVCSLVKKELGVWPHIAGSNAIGLDVCRGAVVGSIDAILKHSVFECRIRGCGKSVVDGDLCETHQENRLKRPFGMGKLTGAGEEIHRLIQPEFVLGVIGLAGAYFEKRPVAPTSEWDAAKDRGRWLASGGLLDDEPRLVSGLHPTVPREDVCDLYRVLLPDGHRMQHAVDAADAKVAFLTAFPTLVEMEMAWPELQRHGVYRGFWLRAAKRATEKLETVTVYVYPPEEAKEMDDCPFCVNALIGTTCHDFYGTKKGSVAIYNAEYLSWGTLLYVLARATAVHVTGDSSKVDGFFDEDRERFLGAAWKALLKVGRNPL